GLRGAGSSCLGRPEAVAAPHGEAPVPLLQRAGLDGAAHGGGAAANAPDSMSRRPRIARGAHPDRSDMPTRRTKQVTPSADRLPVLPLRSTVVYPFGVIGVQIGIPSTLAMRIAAFVVAPGEPDDPFDPRSLEKVGVRVRVSDRLNMPGGTVQATVQGIERIILSDVVETNGYFTAHVEPAKEIPAPD